MRDRVVGTPNLAMSVHVADIESRAAAEALVRRRVDLERFSWQRRVASP